MIIFISYHFVEQSDIVVFPLPEVSWSSQIFIIPVETPNNYLWVLCKQRSSFYCIVSFETENALNYTAVELQNKIFPTAFHGDRTSLNKLQILKSQARIASDEVSKPLFEKHNLLGVQKNYSLRQYDSYYVHGFLRSQQTPREYFLSLTDYSIENKTLNFLKSYYLPRCKVHVISMLGFGVGELKRSPRRSILRGLNPEAPYRIVIGKHWTPDIPYNNPEQFLTYSWFKKNVICQDQPWICGLQRRT